MKVIREYSICSKEQKKAISRTAWKTYERVLGTSMLIPAMHVCPALLHTPTKGKEVVMQKRHNYAVTRAITRAMRGVRHELAMWKRTRLRCNMATSHG